MTQQPQPLADRIAAALRTTVIPGYPTGGKDPAEHGSHRWCAQGCALCIGDDQALAAAVLAVVQPQLDRRDAEIRRLTAELATMTAVAESNKRYVQSMYQDLQQAQQQLARETRVHNETVEERDRATDMADKLAQMIATEDMVGEHTGMNDPWQNTLDLWRELAGDSDSLATEIRRGRAELDDTARMRDFHALSAGHVARKRDRAEQLIGRWRDGHIEAEDVLDRIARTLSAEGDEAPAPSGA
jgi:hypothetical protein